MKKLVRDFIISATQSTSTKDTLKEIRDEYEEASIYRQRLILDHCAALPAADLQNPLRVFSRGRPAGSTSTQRDLSQFEHVKNAMRPRRSCRNCQQVSHNARTCRHITAPASASAASTAPQALLTAPQAPLADLLAPRKSGNGGTGCSIE